MKKKLKISACLLTLGLGVLWISCSVDDNNQFELSAQLENIPEEYLIIGQHHNEGLEFAFQSIKNSYITSTRSKQDVKFTKEELLAIGKQAVFNYCKKTEYFNGNDEFIQNIIEEAEENALTTRSADNNVAYSKELQSLLVKLEFAIFEVGYDEIDKLKYAINRLTLQAQKSLSETELIAFYAGATTAYSSMLYWTENFRKWQIALNYPELLLEFNDDELNDLNVKNNKLVSSVRTRGWWDDVWSTVGEGWDATRNYVSDWWYHGGGKEVVGDDAGGAVAGAIGGAIGGSTAGGAGAVPGAIAGGITGGAVTSISSAISWWISH